MSDPVLYGKYQLLQLLARGGMAEVFKAKSHGVEGFEKVLVIKRILPELSRNPRFVDMFINEAKIAVTLSHANIVQVFDLGRADDSYFIAMEFVAGFDLATVLKLGRKHAHALPLELAVFVVSELAKGLDYAHRRRDAEMRPLNIVHRDVSPQNVLLSYEGEVKLTDFGIAKARTTVEDERESGTLKGKYAYMAPEQALGRAVDARTDLFSIGTVLYESLSQTNPFHATSPYETLQRVRTGDVKPLREVAPHVPDELAAIVGKAMSLEPSHRHANAGQLYEDLIQFLYASGRRVGAHELSNYLAELRERVDKPVEDAPGEDFALLASFEQPPARDVPKTAPPPAVVPPVTQNEAPSEEAASEQRTLTPDVTESQRPPRPATGRPHAERRDVTLVAVVREPGDGAGELSITRVVQRFGGQWVDEDSVGADDGVGLLVFGLREPDGRDLEVAARCALRIATTSMVAASEADSSVGARVGIETGRVVATAEGQLVRDEDFAALAAAALALAKTAKPGEVRAGPGAESQLDKHYELTHDEADANAPKILAAERSFADAYGKFVGRRDELRRVGEMLALAHRGKLTVLALSGDAGSGKTRLVLESMRRLRLGGHDVAMHVATCTQQNRQVPLAAMQEMLRVVLGIEESDSESRMREKVGRLRELGLATEEVSAVATALGLGHDTTSTSTHSTARPLREAMRRIVTKLAEDRLTVFVWDGVEAMDDESQQVLDGLLRGDRDARALVVLAFRTGFVHTWSDLRGYFDLSLGPLPDDDVARLTGARLGAEEVPFDLLREVTLKSGGNPLYVEEYLKALVDAGAVAVTDGRVQYHREIAEVSVPRSMRGIVSSRLSRVTVPQRHLLQIASVAGARFTVELIARVAGMPTAELARELFILEDRGIIARVGNEYAFAHDLIAEVLRDGLPLAARRELHGALARAIESLYEGRVQELAERLANLHREAGDRARAVDYLVLAADRLEAEQSLEGASAFLVKAIEILMQGAKPDHDLVLALYRRIGALAFKSRALESGAERMLAALELAEALGRETEVARFSMLRGRLLGNASRFDDARVWLERAREVAMRLDDQELLRDTALALAETFSKSGEHARAVPYLEEALSISRQTGDVPSQIRCLIPLALALGTTGELDPALGVLEEARRLAQDRADRFTDCEILKVESLIYMQSRDYERANMFASRALELAKEYGFAYEAAINAHNIGEAYLRLGDYKRAFSMLRYSYEAARDIGNARLQMLNLRLLGFIDAVKFGSDEGRGRIVQSIEHATQAGIAWDIIEGRYLLAIVDHMRGEVDEARKSIREVLRLAVEAGYRRYVEDCERALAALDTGLPMPLPA